VNLNEIFFCECIEKGSVEFNFGAYWLIIYHPYFSWSPDWNLWNFSEVPYHTEN